MGNGGVKTKCVGDVIGDTTSLPIEQNIETIEENCMTTQYATFNFIFSCPQARLYKEFYT